MVLIDPRSSSNGVRCCGKCFRRINMSPVVWWGMRNLLSGVEKLLIAGFKVGSGSFIASFGGQLVLPRCVEGSAWNL